MARMTKQQKEEARLQNEEAEKLMNPCIKVQDSAKPVEFGDHPEVLKAHDASKLTDVMSGLYGDDLKGRLYYNLNFMSQRILRQALKDRLTVKPAEETLLNMLSQEDLNDMFGFESEPLYTLEQACGWVMLTFTLAHGVASITEADENGLKSKPFAWMNDLIKTPVTMAASDMAYGLTASVGAQTANMMKLGMPEEVIVSATKKFHALQEVKAKEAFMAKFEVLKPSYDTHYYKNLSTEDAESDLLEMVADLGLDIPSILEDIAQKYKDGKAKNAREGKFIGDVDERIVDILPKDAKEAILEKHREDVAEKAELVASKEAARIATKKMYRVARDVPLTH